jgi:hypothetical protein
MESFILVIKSRAKTLSASNMRGYVIHVSGNSAMVIFSAFALVLLSKETFLPLLVMNLNRLMRLNESAMTMISNNAVG